MENIKNGDILGFHYKKWYYLIGKIIALFAYIINPERQTLLKIEHVGMIFDIRREDDNTIIFTFGECVGHENGNTTSSYSIQNVDGKYLIDSRFRNKGIALYLLPCIRELTEDENTLVKDFWLTQTPYSAVEAAISPNWIQKLLKPFLKNAKKLDRFCSGQVNKCFSNLGFTNLDPLPSPPELPNQSYIDRKAIAQLC